MLPHLPLNPNGKLDRQALPEDGVRADATDAPAQGALEEAIASVWCEALGVEHVGRESNFFDLGGHSLLLIQVHRALEERLALGCSVMDLFSHPTIAALARFLSAGVGERPMGSIHQARARQQRRAVLTSSGQRATGGP